MRFSKSSDHAEFSCAKPLPYREVRVQHSQPASPDKNVRELPMVSAAFAQ